MAKDLRFQPSGGSKLHPSARISVDGNPSRRCRVVPRRTVRRWESMARLPPLPKSRPRSRGVVADHQLSGKEELLSASPALDQHLPITSSTPLIRLRTRQMAMSASPNPKPSRCPPRLQPESLSIPSLRGRPRRRTRSKSGSAVIRRLGIRH